MSLRDMERVSKIIRENRIFSVNFFNLGGTVSFQERVGGGSNLKRRQSPFAYCHVYERLEPEQRK